MLRLLMAGPEQTNKPAAVPEMAIKGQVIPAVIACLCMACFGCSEPLFFAVLRFCENGLSACAPCAFGVVTRLTR